MHLVAKHGLAEAENLTHITKAHVELSGDWFFLSISRPHRSRSNDYIFICSQNEILGYGIIYEITVIGLATVGIMGGMFWKRMGQTIIRYRKLRWFDKPVKYDLKRLWKYVGRRTARRIVNSGVSKEIGTEKNIPT